MTASTPGPTLPRPDPARLTPAPLRSWFARSLGPGTACALLLAVLAIWQLVELQNGTPIDPPHLGAPPPALADPSPTRIQPGELDLAGRPVFQPSRRPIGTGLIAAEAASPDPVASPEATHELVGILGDRSIDGLALLRPRDGGPVLRLRLGSVLEGWELAALDPRSARFRRDGLEVTLPLARPAPVAALQ